MKVTIELTDLQLLKAIALTSATEEQSEALMAAAHETPELDLTELCRTTKDCAELPLIVSAFALAELTRINSTDSLG